MGIQDTRVMFVPPVIGPRIVSVGTANPPDIYTQKQVLEIFREERPKVQALFESVNIKTRRLILPDPVEEGFPVESNMELLAKHKAGVLSVGPEAVTAALTPLGLSPFDIDYMCCISSTGFLCPGISAHLTKEMNFRENIHRIDILGMGCNAGLNGLQPVVNFARARPGKIGLIVCAEICSAAYVYDQKITTAVVNSLFGDGVGVGVIRVDDSDTWESGPVVVDFESHIVTDAIDAMRFDLDGDKYSFSLERDIPYVVGANIAKPVNRLLGRNRLKHRHVDHWIVHGGGRKVIDAIEYNLGVTNHDMRHTHAVMRNFGNLSSGSFLFSFKELSQERVAKEGDLGVIVTMGPGTSIETALISW